MDQLIFVRRSYFEQAVDDVVGRNAVAFGGEIYDQPVTENRLDQFTNVFQGNMRPAVNKRASFGAKDQELRGARTSTPGKLVACEIRSAWFANTRLTNESERVANQMIADRNGADELL